VRQIESPGAAAALGAYDIDQLGGKVFSETKRQKGFAQAPIRAELVSSDRRGISVRGYCSALDLCRQLLAFGYDPAFPPEGWRAESLCARVSAIGQAAKVGDRKIRARIARIRKKSYRFEGCRYEH
jgi:hypothetical protein